MITIFNETLDISSAGLFEIVKSCFIAISVSITQVYPPNSGYIEITSKETVLGRIHYVYSEMEQSTLVRISASNDNIDTFKQLTRCILYNIGDMIRLNAL